MSPPLKRGFIKFSLHRDGKTPDLNIVLKMSTYKLGNTLDDALIISLLIQSDPDAFLFFKYFNAFIISLAVISLFN
jgi:hypothetical protein